MYASIIFTLIGATFAQGCNNAAGCVQQYKSSIQSGCGGVSDNSACLCQNYQSIMTACFTGCSDPASLGAKRSLEADMALYCQNAGSLAPTATLSPINNAFFANNNFGLSSTLIIDNGPTGLAIPMQNNNNYGPPAQATISMAPSPIKISHATTARPIFFTASCIALIATSLC
ncbi:hypothetical protein DSO57_1011847 [Entomophthora muscae]|uniref:Uncharacterized protein n=1 Tax=Entomophthora muscae TaxID=34485 RepID=A0ACC2RKV4_9FUNG|nr:hypothetical protein DSO57_1011847 [Entomophthora muscae]